MYFGSYLRFSFCTPSSTYCVDCPSRRGVTVRINCVWTVTTGTVAATTEIWRTETKVLVSLLKADKTTPNSETLLLVFSIVRDHKMLIMHTSCVNTFRTQKGLRWALLK